jgi:hypothetical protein
VRHDATESNHDLKIKTQLALPIQSLLNTSDWEGFVSTHNETAHPIISRLIKEAQCEQTLINIQKTVQSTLKQTQTCAQYNHSQFSASILPPVTLSHLAQSHLITAWLQQFQHAEYEYDSRQYLVDKMHMKGKIDWPSIVKLLAMQEDFQHDPELTGEGDTYYVLALLAAELHSFIPSGSWIDWKKVGTMVGPVNSVKPEQRIYDIVGELCTKHHISRHFICNNFKYLAFGLMEWNQSESACFHKAAALFEAEFFAVCLTKAAELKAKWIDERNANEQQKQEERLSQTAAAMDSQEKRTKTLLCTHCDVEYQYVEPDPSALFIDLEEAPELSQEMADAAVNGDPSPGSESQSSQPRI